MTTKRKSSENDEAEDQSINRKTMEKEITFDYFDKIGSNTTHKGTFIKNIIVDNTPINCNNRNLEETDDDDDDESIVTSKGEENVNDRNNNNLIDKDGDEMQTSKSCTESDNCIQKPSDSVYLFQQNCNRCLHKYDNVVYKKEVDRCGHEICNACKLARQDSNCQLCLPVYCTTVLTNDENTASSYDVNLHVPQTTTWSFYDIKDSTSEFARNNFSHAQLMKETLQSVFGLQQFRQCQREAINAVLTQQNCFVMIPSGGGKSLIYQLPAYLSRGITIVISPLRSLIYDQVAAMTKVGIKAAHMIGTEQENDFIKVDFTRALPVNRMIFLTPERFKTEDMKKVFIQAEKHNNIARIVIDEVHCVATWGLDFRRAYMSMKYILNKLLTKIPLTLLTASATPQVRKKIIQLLDIRPNHNIKYFLNSFDRPNLQYEMECINPSQKQQRILDVCTKPQFIEATGIVYCISKTECDEMSLFLRQQDVKALSYHAGLKDIERLDVQNKWSAGDPKCRVIVATIAFGLGVNKPNVRFVIHCGLPKSLEGFYQESGRAGRDGLYAFCKMFWTSHDSKMWIDTLAKSKRISKNAYYALLDAQVLVKQKEDLDNMEKFAAEKAQCRRKILLRYFGQEYSDDFCKANIETICDNCLKYMSDIEANDS